MDMLLGLSPKSQVPNEDQVIKPMYYNFGQ